MIDIFDKALDELEQITKKIPVNENSCANCKYCFAFGAGIGRREMILKCMFGVEDSINDGKYIGRVHPDSLQTKNRRYSVRQRREMTRKRIAHVCENHVKEYRQLMI